MGKFEEISKFMEYLDNKYQKKWEEEKVDKDKDALIEHIEEEYKKNNNEDVVK